MEQDPRELARRLAEQAKQRLRDGTSASEDPRELARRLAEEAKQRIGGSTGEPDAPPPPNKKMTAQEALAKARAERRAASATPAAVEPLAPHPMPPAEPAPPMLMEPDGTDSEPTMPIPGSDTVVVSRLISGLLAAARVVEQEAVSHPDVFRAMWRAHLARARREGQIRIVSLATVLLDALDRLEPGRLVACRVEFEQAPWAVWVDLDREILLGVAQPADTYLTGM